jgi:hypothetical protein
METPTVDWAALTLPEFEIECKCGAIYRSIGKAIRYQGRIATITQKPCPNCHKTFDHVRRMKSSPEIAIIKSSK